MAIGAGDPGMNNVDLTNPANDLPNPANDPTNPANDPTTWIDYAEDRKVYVSSLPFAARDDNLKEYFEKYGEVEKAEVKMESTTRSRGFGFVIFVEPGVVDSVIEMKHTLDGREIEVKRAITMKEKFSTNKLFVGGLAPKLTNEEIDEFFKKFGPVQDIEWVVDRVTGNRKGFCFVIYEKCEAVEAVTEGKVPPQSQKHSINGYTVECKKKFADSHPVQKRIKRIQQQKRERAMAYESAMGYGYDYGGYYDYYGGYGYGGYPPHYGDSKEGQSADYYAQFNRPTTPVST